MKEITDLTFLALVTKVENLATNFINYKKEHKKTHSSHSDRYYWAEWLDEKQLMERKLTDQELRIHALEVMYGDLTKSKRDSNL